VSGSNQCIPGNHWIGSCLTRCSTQRANAPSVHCTFTLDRHSRQIVHCSLRIEVRRCVFVDLWAVFSLPGIVSFRNVVYSALWTVVFRFIGNPCVCCSLCGRVLVKSSVSCVPITWLLAYL
jgi:hypothetical protein